MLISVPHTHPPWPGHTSCAPPHTFPEMCHILTPCKPCYWDRKLLNPWWNVANTSFGMIKISQVKKILLGTECKKSYILDMNARGCVINPEYFFSLKMKSEHISSMQNVVVTYADSQHIWSTFHPCGRHCYKEFQNLRGQVWVSSKIAKDRSIIQEKYNVFETTWRLMVYGLSSSLSVYLLNFIFLWLWFL